MIQYYRTRSDDLIAVYTATFDATWMVDLVNFIGSDNVAYIGCNFSSGVYIGNQWEIIEQGNCLVKSKDGISLVQDITMIGDF